MSSICLSVVYTFMEFKRCSVLIQSLFGGSTELFVWILAEPKFVDLWGELDGGES